MPSGERGPRLPPKPGRRVEKRTAPSSRDRIFPSSATTHTAPSAAAPTSAGPSIDPRSRLPASTQPEIPPPSSRADAFRRWTDDCGSPAGTAAHTQDPPPTWAVRQSRKMGLPVVQRPPNHPRPGVPVVNPSFPPAERPHHDQLTCRLTNSGREAGARSAGGSEAAAAAAAAGGGGGGVGGGIFAGAMAAAQARIESLTEEGLDVCCSSPNETSLQEKERCEKFKQIHEKIEKEKAQLRSYAQIIGMVEKVERTARNR